MTALRTKPVINKERDSVSPPKPDNDPMGCVIVPVGTVIGYFIVSAIVHVTSGSGNELEQLICYGTLIFMVFICILGFRDMYKGSQVAAAERQQWKKACTTVEVRVLSHRSGATWDDGYRYHYARPRLELEMNSDQRAVDPYNTTVSVEIWDSLYRKMEKRTTVRIYYKPEAPLTFLLEEEI